MALNPFANSKFSLTPLVWNRAKITSKKFRGDWDFGGESFTSDATISENYFLGSEVNKYPVEGGYPVSDMSAMNNFSVSISAVNSNASMSLVDISKNPLDIVAGSAAGIFLDLETKVQKAYKTLENWATNGTPLSLKCTYAPEGYKDPTGSLSTFVMSSFGIQRDRGTGDAIGYTMTLERIIITRISQTSRGDIAKKDNQGVMSPEEAKTKGNENKLDSLKEADQFKVSKDGTKVDKTLNAVEKATEAS